jgi:hypothetical protein
LVGNVESTKPTLDTLPKLALFIMRILAAQSRPVADLRLRQIHTPMKPARPWATRVFHAACRVGFVHDEFLKARERQLSQ